MSEVKAESSRAHHLSSYTSDALNNPNKTSPELVLINSIAAHYLQLLRIEQLVHKSMSQIFLGFKFQE